MRLLERLEFDGHAGIVVELSAEAHGPGCQRLAQDLQRFEIHLLPLIGINPVISSLDRRNAAPDAEIETAAADLVEHADFLRHSERMVQRQGIDQRPETQVLRALSDRGKEHAGRGGKAQRRRMMLGGMIRVEATAIVSLDQLQSLLVKLVQGNIIAIEMIEYPDFHLSLAVPR